MLRFLALPILAAAAFCGPAGADPLDSAIHDEMQNVPLKDEVWPKFLRDNAVRVFKLDG